MEPIQEVVIKDGRVVTADHHHQTRLYAGVAIVATMVAAGLGGYVLGQKNTPQVPAQESTQSPSPGAPTSHSNTPESTNTAQTSAQLIAAVSAALAETKASTSDEKKFLQAQQEYLRQPQETAEQLKARLDKLAADPKALEAHNKTVMNRVAALPTSDQNRAGGELMNAVSAAQEALKNTPKDASTSALKAEAAVREAAGKTYLVKPGDTLWGIAQRIYGDPYQYKRLFEANPRILAAADHIFPGQELRVPD